MYLFAYTAVWLLICFPINCKGTSDPPSETSQHTHAVRSWYQQTSSVSNLFVQDTKTDKIFEPLIIQHREFSLLAVKSSSAVWLAVQPQFTHLGWAFKVSGRKQRVQLLGVGTETFNRLMLPLFMMLYSFNSHVL